MVNNINCDLLRQQASKNRLFLILVFLLYASDSPFWYLQNKMWVKCLCFPFPWVCGVLLYSMGEFDLGKNRTLFFYYLNILNQSRIDSFLLQQPPTQKIKNINKLCHSFQGYSPNSRISPKIQTKVDELSG